MWKVDKNWRKKSVDIFEVWQIFAFNFFHRKIRGLPHQIKWNVGCKSILFLQKCASSPKKGEKNETIGWNVLACVVARLMQRWSVHINILYNPPVRHCSGDDWPNLRATIFIWNINTTKLDVENVIFTVVV